VLALLEPTGKASYFFSKLRRRENVMDGLNLQACFEFLDGTAALVKIPVWLGSAKSLFALYPGTGEGTYVHYVKTTKAGVPIYRERPVAKVLPFKACKKRKSDLKYMG
jgi:hypothetical protein